MSSSKLSWADAKYLIYNSIHNIQMTVTNPFLNAAGFNQWFDPERKFISCRKAAQGQLSSKGSYLGRIARVLVKFCFVDRTITSTNDFFFFLNKNQL